MKFLGALTGTMSGSLGGVTASHNRGGQYLRQRVVPTNPNTLRQQSIRSFLGSAANAWTELLTDQQRIDWSTYAANTPTTDSLGQALVLTGQQSFIRSMVPRFQTGNAIIPDAPTIFDTGQSIVGVETLNNQVGSRLGIDSGSSTMSTTATMIAPATAAGNLLCYIGRPLNPSIAFYKGPYQLASVLSVASAQQDVQWTVPISTLTSETKPGLGDIVPIRFRIIYDDGRLSEKWEAILPVVEDNPS